MVAVQKRYRQLSFFGLCGVSTGGLGGSTIGLRPEASKQRVQSTAYLNQDLYSYIRILYFFYELCQYIFCGLCQYFQREHSCTKSIRYSFAMNFKESLLLFIMILKRYTSF